MHRSTRPAPRHAHRRRREPRTTPLGRLLVTAGVATAIPAFGLAAPAQAQDGGTWDQLAQCESGGNWSASTGNGYSGGLQFAPGTWRANGGSGSAANASREEQIAVAQRVLASQGWGAWPACSRKLGLRGGGGGGGSSAAPAQSSQSNSSNQSSSRASRSSRSSAAQTEPARQARRAAPAGPAITRAPSTAAVAGADYVVQPGDSLSSIARQFAIPGGWPEIYARNQALLAGNPDLVFPGEQLDLR